MATELTEKLREENMDVTKEQYANNAIEFLARVARARLSSEYAEDEEPKPPMEVLDSLIMHARELTDL